MTPAQCFESVSQHHCRELKGYADYPGVRCMWYGVQPVGEGSALLVGFFALLPATLRGPLAQNKVTVLRGHKTLMRGVVDGKEGGPSTDPGFSLLQCTFHFRVFSR